MKNALTILLVVVVAVFSVSASAGENEAAASRVTLDASSLVNSLDVPSKQVRYHAAAALVKLKPKTPFRNSEKVVPLLSQALSERGARVAMVATSDVQTMNLLQEGLAKSGFIVDVATTEKAAMNVALSAPLKDIIFVDAQMADAFKLFQRDYRTAGKPKVLIADEGNIKNLRPGLQGVAKGFISTPVEPEAVASVLNDVLKDLPVPTAKSMAARFNLLAAKALANACPKCACFALDQATPSLVNALKLPDNVKLPSMKALARIGAVEAVPSLALVARKGGGSPEARLAAVKTIDAISRKAGAMDPKAKALMDLLLLDSNTEIRNAAAIALGANDPVDSALKRLVDNPDPVIDETIGD